MSEHASMPEDIDDGLPLVAQDMGNRPLWLGLGAIVLGGAVLFTVLESNRAAQQVPAVKARPSDLSASNTSIPELFIPPERRVYVVPQPMPSASSDMPKPVLQPVPLPSVYPPPAQTTEPAPSTFPPAAQRPAPDRSGPIIVYESGASITSNAGSTPTPDSAPLVAQKARATRTGNRTFLVAQGTIIQAVLETALDSTQAGQVRALVSRDVRNTKGDIILIPKGSRLYGDYKADMSTGQKRANVFWSRLLRPDGVAINLDSPATDELGRAGIGGQVNTHFLERFGSALLQSTLDIGVIAATRQISDSSVILALPSSVQGATSQLIPPPAKPTLRVKQGTRISVFVARDLDFSGVGGAK